MNRGTKPQVCHHTPDATEQTHFSTNLFTGLQYRNQHNTHNSMPYNERLLRFAIDVDGDEIQLPAYNLIIGFNRLRSFNLRQTLGYRNTSAKKPKKPRRPFDGFV